MSMKKEAKDVLRELNMQQFQRYAQELNKMYSELYDANRRLSDKLLNYDKDSEIAKLKDEIKDIRKHSLAILSESELKSLNTFQECHREKCKNSGDWDYQFSDSSLGSAITVICPLCGESLDIVEIR